MYNFIHPSNSFAPVRPTSAPAGILSPRSEQFSNANRNFSQSHTRATVEDVDETADETTPQFPQAAEISSSFIQVPSPYIDNQLIDPKVRASDVDEAVCKVNYINAKREVRALERAAIHARFKEVYALNELIKVQAAQADKRFFEVDKELGRMKVELTDARIRARNIVLENMSLADVIPEFERMAMH